MPTGYTAKLAEGPQDIQDFMKGLARGMGFCLQAQIDRARHPTGADQ